MAWNDCSPVVREPLALRRENREPEDDFFCLRYQVWYPSFDCALRTRFRTSPGCLACDQGRFNHQRHRASIGALPGRLLRLYSNG